MLLPCLELACSDRKNVLAGERTIPAHPRILMLAGDENQIRSNIENDSSWNALHEYIIEECNRIVKKPLVEYQLEGKRLLNKTRECRKRVFYLSYAWRLTNDNAYLARAEKELLAAANLKDWNPSHFLDVAELTMALAIGYDWLFHDLPDSTLMTLKKAIIEKGLEPSLIDGNDWWAEESGNWNQVCNAAMTFGALAIYEDDRELAQKIINRSINSVKLAMQVYEPDGAFPEGYMYWGYGTTFNVYLISALEKAFDTDFGLANNTAFFRTAGYLLNMIGPTGQNFNYSDGGSNLIVNPAMFWLANRQKDHSLLYTEKKILEKYLYAVRDLPALMIWGAPVGLKQITQPKEIIWVGRGKNPVALMRTSWENEAIYVGLKGGSARQNGHSHLDVGSFVMDADGERWAMDLGGQDYTAVEAEGVDLWSRKQGSDRWKLFRYNNLAHNTLTFNNEFQRVEGYAPLLSYSADESFLSAILDITEVYRKYVKSARRGIAIIDKRYVLVQDEIESSSESTSLRWTMVTPADVRIINSTTAELTQNGRKLILKVTAPQGVSLTTWSTAPTRSTDEPNPGTIRVGFEMNLQARSKTVLTVLLIPGELAVGEIETPLLSQWPLQKSF
jgi:hypothetical protein